METLRPTSVVRFGTYEVSLQSGEVRKAGLRIRVQQQPLKLLEILLERPGEVVTREELRGRVCADDTVGDFDQAVNIAIAKLRSALGDSAENPRYIETLPKRGYRFIADVSFVDADGRVRRPEPASAGPPVTEPVHQLQSNGLAIPPVVTEPEPPLQKPATAVASQRPRWLTRRVIMALALVLSVAILSVFLFRSRRRTPIAIRSL